MYRRPRAWLVEIVRFRRDEGAGPAVDEFRGAGGEVDASVAARLTEVIVPVRAVEGDARAGEEAAPRDAWQIVDADLRVALVGHMDGRAFVVGGILSLRRFRAARAAGTTRPHVEAFVFEGHQVLSLQIHVDGFQGVGNVARKRSQLNVRHEADVRSVEVKVLVQVVVVNLVPDASVHVIDVDGGYPMGRAVVGAIGVVGVETVATARVGIGDGDFAERLLAFEFCDGRLQLGVDGLEIGGMDEAIGVAIPDAVVRPLARQLGLQVNDLVFAEQFDLLRFERRGFIDGHAADGGASLKRDGGFGEDSVESQLGQRESKEPRGAEFKKFASG